MVFTGLGQALVVFRGYAQGVVALGAEQPRAQVLLVQLIEDVVAVDNRSLEFAQPARGVTGDFRMERRE